MKLTHLPPIFFMRLVPLIYFYRPFIGKNPSPPTIRCCFFYKLLHLNGFLLPNATTTHSPQKHIHLQHTLVLCLFIPLLTSQIPKQKHYSRTTHKYNSLFCANILCLLGRFAIVLSINSSWYDPLEDH